MLELRRAHAADGMDVYAMLQQLPADENGFMNPVAGMAFEAYKEWLKKKVQESEQVGLRDGWKVPSTTYWLLEDGRPVGCGKVRHFMTDKLLEEGGNVGYAIVPSERGRGLGRQLLAMLLEECRGMGIEKVLLTIQNTNEPSVRVALANGAKLEKKNDIRGYYWIEL